MHGAHVCESHVHGAHVCGAHERGVHVRGAYVHGADVRGLHVRRTHVRGAHERGVHVRGAHVCGANVRGAQVIAVSCARGSPVFRNSGLGTSPHTLSTYSTYGVTTYLISTFNIWDLNIQLTGDLDVVSHWYVTSCHYVSHDTSSQPAIGERFPATRSHIFIYANNMFIDNVIYIINRLECEY